LYTAHFLVDRPGPENFVADGISPYKSDNLHPFMTFDLAVSSTGLSNVVGPAFHLPPLAILNVVGDKDNSATPYPGYNFVSIIVDTQTNENNQLYVYLAGWDPSLTNNAFVIARTSITAGSSNPLSPITPSDVIYLPSTAGCYDQYDERNHPELYFSQDHFFFW